MIDHPPAIIKNLSNVAEAMATKYKNKRPCEIKEEREILAIAFVSGNTYFAGPFEQNGQLVMQLKTKNPCSVFWNGKVFLHAINKNKKGN